MSGGLKNRFIAAASKSVILKMFRKLKEPCRMGTEISLVAGDAVAAPGLLAVTTSAVEEE
jgi:hypothetical protein